MPDQAEAVASDRPAALQFNFRLLHDALRHNYDTYIRNVWSTITALLVTISWLFTSDSTSDFLGSTGAARWATIVGICVMCGMHLLALAEVWRISTRLMRLLESDGYVSQQILTRDYYGQFSVPGVYVVASGILNGTLFIVLVTLVWST
jgi:hypothetical protein